MKRLVVTTMLLLLPAALFANVPEIGWPRAIEAAEGEIVIYQPQLDSLEGDKLTGRAAVSVALTDSEEPVFGVIRFESRMETDRDARTMRIVDLDITHVGFTDATDAQKDRRGDEERATTERRAESGARSRQNGKRARAQLADGRSGSFRFVWTSLKSARDRSEIAKGSTARCPLPRA